MARVTRLCDPERGLSGGAIGYVKRVAGDEPALYLMARAHAEQGHARVAIRYLEQAIEANPDNRVLARIDPDLDALGKEAALVALLDSASALQASGKRAARR